MIFKRQWCIVLIALIFGLPAVGSAQVDDASPPLLLDQPVINPAEEMRMRQVQEATTQPTTAEAPQRLPSFEMPAVTVIGERPPELREEEYIGSYAQPRWTADRRFPSTRIYVLPPQTAEFEFWLRPTSPRHGQTELRSLAELEMGLPGRFQVDLYARTESMSDAPTQVGESVELRYAFADWNKIWGNPTLYVEWSRLENEADSIEFKLLLGGQIAPRWHWGLNLSDELAMGDNRSNEIEITGGASYALQDSRFSIGAETECGVVDTHRHRGRFDDNFYFLGPSFQYFPTERIHIDLAPMVGLSGDSPAFRVYLVIGYEF